MWLQVAQGQPLVPAGQQTLVNDSVTKIAVDNTSSAPIAFFYLDRFDDMGTITQPPIKGLPLLHKKIGGNSPVVLRYSLQNLVVPFILLPGDSVAIGFTAQGMPTVTYSQRGMQMAYNVFANRAVAGPNLMGIANRFLTQPQLFDIDALYSNDSSYLTSLATQNQSLRDYYALAQQYLQSQYHLYLLQRDKKMPPVGFTEQASHLIFHNFRELLTDQLYIIHGALRKNPTAMMEAYYQAAMTAQGDIKNYLLYYTLKWMKNKNRSLYEKRKGAFVQHCTDKAYVADLVTEIPLGKQPGFYSFFDGSQRAFADLLQAHKGKVIYMDVWASWCVPCRASMVASRLLQQQYAPKGVVFVYASIDDNAMTWTKAVKEEGLTAWPYNYLITARKTNDFIKRFRIANIPRYLLYDTKGQLVDDNAPAPELAELKALLDKLLR